QAVLQTVTASPGSLAPAYAQPEGVRTLDVTHLVGTMGPWGQSGFLVELTQSAPDTWTSSVIRNNLQGPTSVILSKGNYFIVGGEAPALVNCLFVWSEPPPNPNLPFLIQRQTAE